MKLATLILLLLVTAASAKEKDKSPLPDACLAVYPGGEPCIASAGIHAGKTTPGCFSYLESENLPLKEINTYYFKKDLQALEDRGVKIVVTDPSRVAACKK
jgi:hypothetical protein